MTVIRADHIARTATPPEIQRAPWTPPDRLEQRAAAVMKQTPVQTTAPAAACTARVRPAATPLSAAELETRADRVLSASSDADKQRTLVRELSCLDADSGARLMSLLGRRVDSDSHMGPEWFSARGFEKAVGERVLTRAQVGTVAEAFARAYDNAICRSPSGCYMDSSSAFGHDAAGGFLLTGHTSYVEDIAAVNRFLNSGSPSVMDAFVRDYVKQDLVFVAASPHQGNHDVMRTETLMHLLAGAGTSEMVVEVFSGLDAKQRASLYALMQHSFFPRDATAPDGEKLVSGWAASDDPLAILMQAVGGSRGLGSETRIPGLSHPVGRETQVTPADQLALELVSWAHANPDAFWSRQTAIPDRASAMATLVRNHLPHLLNVLTTPTVGADDSSGRALPANLDEVQALANALRLTMLNGSVPEWQRTLIQQRLFDYIDGQAESFDPNRPGWNPMERVGLVMSAVQMAVSQGWRSAEDQRAAQEQMVGFFTDLLIDQAASAATGKLTPAGKLASIIGGQVIDAASEEGKAFVREALTNFLFGKDDRSELSSLQARVNALTDAYVEQLPASMQTQVIQAIRDMRTANNEAGD